MEPSPIGEQLCLPRAKQAVPCCKASNQDETPFLLQDAPFSYLGYGKVPPILEHIADLIS